MRASERTTETDERWAAMLARDAACDGAFVFAVRSTGIYCRPSCPARRPKRENVVFFDTPGEAEAAGFRACLRCAPATADSPHGRRREAVMRACALIHEAETAPSLDALAETAGMSRFHFHRQFKREVGLTPKQYIAARRAQAVRNALPGATSVTAAIHDAGYASAARFYERAGATLGMQPAAYRAGGAGQTIRHGFGDSTLGRVLAAATERGLCAIFLGDRDDDLSEALRKRFPKARLQPAAADVTERIAAVLAHIEGEGRADGLPLDVQGTAFQQRVWAALSRIPWGETRTYSEIAQAVGAPTATRAVANACGANPLAVLIPCHRVLRADGGLGGYRWGVARKKALLDRERLTD